MKTDELREKYLEYFVAQGHARRSSDVLVPHGDPSVLFTPAGMNQFKDHFLGKVKLDFTRATTSQKCLRTGDIDNVGRTAYHHTFFEMLGNFSFGDYFKREAILWAWEFLTDKKWLGLDPDRLSATVYLDDDQAASIWADDVGLPGKRIVRMDEDENFWPASAPSHGPDGVCGPCSEIYYLGDDGVNVEIWNLVFTQFNRVGDPPDNLRPLPSKNIDTGMGLERTAAVLQGVTTNYHIDILLPIVEAVAEVCGISYQSETEDGRRCRRITDHLRACTFAIHENVEPGTKKQSYVIRRLLRRAVLDGHQMGLRAPFLYQLVPTVADMMQVPYPELTETTARVSEEIKQEETAFLGTLDEGLARINEVFNEMQSSGRVMISGRESATLYTTYGVPPELVEQEANDRGFTFDWDSYREAMEEHGKVSGGDKHVLFQVGAIESIKGAVRKTDFVGYDSLSCAAKLRGIVCNNKSYETFDAVAGQSPVVLILDRSPFYGESGGQVGDSGKIYSDDFEFVVTDTQRDSDLLLHFGNLVKGTMRAGEEVTAEVDTSRRDGLSRAHSATHLLHYALQQNLGEHAQQRGSKVEQDWLRFDFKNRSQIESDVLSKIEKEVNEKIGQGDPIQFQSLPLEEARQRGAMMLFGEKYPDIVRMVSVGDYSKELCGGTHLENSIDIRRFEIVSEEAVSAGTRRIVALTGDKAKENAEKTTETLRVVSNQIGAAPSTALAKVSHLAREVRDLKKELSTGNKVAAGEEECVPTPSTGDLGYDEIRTALKSIARILNVPLFEIPDRIDSLLQERDQLKQQISQLNQAGTLSADLLLEEAELVDGVKLIARETPGATPNLMRQMIDQIRKKANPVAICLGAGQGEDKVMLVAGISRDLVDKGISAGQWVKDVAPKVGGGGGGKPDMAQAGGKDPSKLPEAMSYAKAVMKEYLGP